MAKKPLGTDSMGIQKTMRVGDYLGDCGGQFALNAMTGLVSAVLYFYTEKVGVAAATAASFAAGVPSLSTLGGDDKALEAIADKAIERKIGARGLRAVMEGLLMNVMYDIPSDRTIDRVTITPGCVEGTEQPKISHRTEKEGEAPQPSLPADSAS